MVCGAIEKRTSPPQASLRTASAAQSSADPGRSPEPNPPSGLAGSGRNHAAVEPGSWADPVSTGRSPTRPETGSDAEDPHAHLSGQGQLESAAIQLDSPRSNTLQKQCLIPPSVNRNDPAPRGPCGSAVRRLAGHHPGDVVVTHLAAPLSKARKPVDRRSPVDHDVTAQAIHIPVRRQTEEPCGRRRLRPSI